LEEIMAKVKQVKAGKDYPQFGIKKGEMHYTWELFRQPVQRSKTPPRRSQLTGSSFLSQFYDLVDVTLPAAAGKDDLESLAESERELASEAQEAFDNMPEGLQQGDTGQKLENRVSELEAWADEIETAAGELPDEPSGSDEEIEAANKERTDEGEDTFEEALAAAIAELESSAPDPE